MPKSPLTVAYFTMEIGLESRMPTFAGGLGMLAADIMRSTADTGIAGAEYRTHWILQYAQVCGGVYEESVGKLKIEN